MYMQYGCGLSAPSAWVNFDASPTLRVQRIPGVGSLVGRSDRYPRFPANVRYGDIVRGLPIDRASCKGIYCSHVLEHLALDDLRLALQNTRGYLASNGVFRLVVPDLEKLARDYLESTSEDASLEFMLRAHLGSVRRARGVSSLARKWLGNSSHLWMWDYKSLSRELATAGFSSIRRAELGDSSDPRFDDVEEESRWTDCLGIECRV